MPQYRPKFTLAIAAAIASTLLLSACNQDSSSSSSATTVIVPAAGQVPNSAQAQSTAADAGSGGADFSGQVPSDAPRINVQMVQQALSDVQASDPDNWVQDFQKRVNEIYEGKDVVSVDVKPDAANNLTIIGYISRSNQQGFQPGDDELFEITQTGAVADNQVPYRMTYYTYGGTPAYYDGSFANAVLTQLLVNQLWYNSWHGYYTTPSRLGYISTYRSTYRSSPVYVQQRAATRSYITNTYSGSPVTVRPGATIGTGVTVRPGAAVKVTAPAASAPSMIAPTRPSAPVPSIIAPSRPSASAPSLFARPSASVPSVVVPARPSAGSSSIFNRPSSSGSSSRRICLGKRC